MSLRDQLEAVRAKHGYLTPEVVVADARAKSHPLHSRFEWDDKVAGEAYRRDQAHRLIQSVRVKYTADERPRDVRAYLPVYSGERKAPTYEPTEDVMRDDFTHQLVLQQMEREWRTLQARYGDLVEFADMVRAAVREDAAA